jgi:hypothetical protein
MTYYDFVCQPRFFSFLLEIDRSIANEAHKKLCTYCGGKLDCGDFFRTGYGIPDNCKDELRRRFSFCCRNCRKRETPDSLRFMRGFGYAALIVVLLSAIQNGVTEERARTLTRALRVSRQTISRWIKWWRDDFATSPFWKAARGRLPVEYSNLEPPSTIINAFHASHADLKTSLVSLLHFFALFPK